MTQASKSKGNGPMKITAKIARIVAREKTPTGVAGILIQCDCGNHPRGNRAYLRESNPTPTMIHGNVEMAYSAWAGGRSALLNGPWKA